MTNCKAEKKGIKNMNILSLLASDNYIVINRDLLKKYGINVTLMLCELASEYNYFDKSGMLDDGMFFSTIENIYEKTGLSKYQQTEALKVLDKIGIVKSVVKGIPAKRYFKIDVEELAKQIVNISTSSCKEIGKLDGEKVETKNNNKKVLNKSNNLKDKESKKEDNNNTQIEHVEKSTCRKKKKTISYDEQIAEYTQNEELQDALKAFIQMRAFIKSPVTEHGLKLLLNKLTKISRNDAEKITIVNNSIENNWKGFYGLKEEKSYQKSVQPEKKYDQNGYGSEEELMAMFYGK